MLVEFIQHCKLHYYDQKIRQTHEALHFTVAGWISDREDHGIHCSWDLIRSKQLSSVSVCHAQVFAGFSGHSNSIYNIIPRLRKENIHLSGIILKS